MKGITLSGTWRVNPVLRCGIFCLLMLLFGLAKVYAQTAAVKEIVKEDPKPSETCVAPTGIVVSSITKNSIGLKFTLPASGIYEWTLHSEGNVVLTGKGKTETKAVSVKIGDLKPLTTYTFSVRTHCKTGGYSEWATNGATELITACDHNDITGTSPKAICGPGRVKLGATASGGILSWYGQKEGGNVLGTGTTFTTPKISATTSYWVTTKIQKKPVITGPVSPTAQGGKTKKERLAIPVLFTVLKETKLVAVDIFPENTGKKGTLVIKDRSTNKEIATHLFTTVVSGGTTAQTIVLDQVLTAGEYVLIPELPEDGGRVTMNDSGTRYPYVSEVARITGNETAEKYYPGLYNWKFETYCESPRTEVVATVVAAPAPPTGNTAQTISVASVTEATVAKIQATGENIEWFATAANAKTGTNPLAGTTPLKDAATYYAMQTVKNCRSTTPLAVTIKITLGTDSYTLPGLEYYPNPVTTVFKLTHTNTIDSVAVFNLVGQQLIAVTPNAAKASVDMSALPSGTYIIRIQAEGQFRSVKIVKK